MKGMKASDLRTRSPDELSDQLDTLGKGRKVHRDRLATETRWSHLTRAAERPPEGYVELGELCRVHRGAVTGANDIWIAGDHSVGLPDSVLFPTVTRAREVLEPEAAVVIGQRGPLAGEPLAADRDLGLAEGLLVEEHPHGSRWPLRGQRLVRR